MEDESTERIGEQRKDRIRLLSIGIFLVLALAVAYSLHYPAIATLRTEISKLGFLAPLVLIGVYTLATLLFVPKNFLSIAAGAAFGLLPGIAYVLIGATIGSIVAFWSSRYFGRSAIERLAGHRISQLDARLRESPFVGILIARLIPVVPFTLLNYASGLSAVAFFPYVAATVIGMIPGTASYVALGAYGTKLHSWAFALAAVIFVALWTLTHRLLRASRG